MRVPVSPLSILALDTATETCSVAVLAGTTLTARAAVVGQRHSERLLPMVDEALRDAGLTLDTLDVIAFGAGPGSFTGLRIACGAAQGLAWARSVPVIAVGNLEALAAHVLAAQTDCGSVLCAIDARMQEAYCAVYRRGAAGGAPVEVLPPTLAQPSVLADLARDLDAVAGDALRSFPAAWQPDARQRRYPELRATAADIARVAATPEGRARARPARDAAPLYVRDQVALTIEQRMEQRMEQRRDHAAAMGGASR